ncbi:sulfatase/phosphatase domain-containing protein, partial [Parabacteroides leei]
DRYKLIHFYNDIDSWELFDLQNDPHEMNNVYSQKEYEQVVKDMKQELLRLQEKYDDPIRLTQNR